MKNRIINDEQIKVMCWYVTRILYNLSVDEIKQKTGMKYDWCIRELFDEIDCYENLDGENIIINDEAFGRAYSIIEKEYERNN